MVPACEEKVSSITHLAGYSPSAHTTSRAWGSVGREANLDCLANYSARARAADMNLLGDKAHSGCVPMVGAHFLAQMVCTCSICHH